MALVTHGRPGPRGRPGRARGAGARVETSGPVTVVVVGGWGDDGGGEPGGGDDDLAELPDVRLLARADDPRRAPRLVGDARPQVVLAGLGRDRDAVLAVVPELAARAPGTPVLALAGPGRRGGPGRRRARRRARRARPATSSPPATPAPSPTPSGARPRGRRCSAPGWPVWSWRRPGAPAAGRGPADRPGGRRPGAGGGGADGAPDRDAARALPADGGEPHPAGAAPAGRAQPGVPGAVRDRARARVRFGRSAA